jgi:Zn-dependent membrane protease YugP
MHPVLVLIPVATLFLGPRLWANHVLRQHNRQEEDLPLTARELARELLDAHDLQQVRVESTDLGDHYDPRTRAVRLARDKIDRKSLTALTTAAHEVAHAIQHASDYGPFIWRGRLARVARVAGEAGFVLLLAVPVTAMTGRRPVPPEVVGTAALTMLGTGMTAQLAALPSELDASFTRALPMLEENYIDAEQVQAARQILTACSMTYIASSLLSILHVWPWLGPKPGATALQAGLTRPTGTRTRYHEHNRRQPARRHRRPGTAAALVRKYGKPLIREWIRLSRQG